MRVEFSDGDSWWFRSLRIGDTVYCQPDACARYGLDANTINRGMGVPFVNEAPVKGGEKTCHWGGVKLYHLGGA